jgi:hypothetical protein
MFRRFRRQNKIFQEHGFKTAEFGGNWKDEADYRRNASIAPVIGWDPLKIV